MGGSDDVIGGWMLDIQNADRREAKILALKSALHDTEQALAAKDREIASMKHEYAQLKEAYNAKVAGVPLGPIVGAQTIVNQQIAYQQLMEKAVRFAEDVVAGVDDAEIAAAVDFIKSPEVQAWKE